MATDKYIAALFKAINNERDRMERRGTKSVVIINKRKGFVEGLEHAILLYGVFKEDTNGKS